jgi:hypothetical protein
MARGGTVNMKGIGAQVAKTKAFKAACKKSLDQRAQQAKALMLNDFHNHPVTVEIEGGVRAVNLSNTLGGLGSGGNLFTYIGFDAGSNPTLAVKTYLKDSVRVGAVRTRVSPGKNKIEASCNVFYPDLRFLRKISKLPWEPGKSWIEGMENGISGFGYYMNRKFEESRSGLGLQTKKKIRQGHFRPTPYLSQIIHKFLKRLGINK